MHLRYTSYVLVVLMVADRWQYVTPALGATCTTDTDCTANTANSECKTDGSTKKCACVAGYLETDGTTTCTKVVLGGICTLTTDCTANTVNSECKTDGGTKKCECVAGYFGGVGTFGATACVQVVIGFDCSFFNYFACGKINNAECEAPSTYKCKCKKGYVGIAGQSTCTQVTLDMDCSFFNYFNCLQIDNAECQVPGFLCKCKAGFFGTAGGTTCTAPPAG